MSTPEFTLPAFAKINWCLRVLGQRSDGYHEVFTVLQTVSLHDDLHFSNSERDCLTFSCDVAAIPTDGTNLVVRAAAALRLRYNIRRGAVIHLEKRIPVQAGLGGASSNAAIALIGLSRLWRLNCSFEELSEIGKALGADVPFFLVGGCVLGRGIGNELAPLRDVDHLQLLVVTPNAAISTEAAYSALKAGALTTASVASILRNSCEEALLSDPGQWSLYNDFEDVIFEIEPEIRRAHQALLEAGAGGALLAGSGSSVFGVFHSKAAQARALEEIDAERGWRVFPCVTLSRNEYRQALSLGENMLPGPPETRFHPGA